MRTLLKAAVVLNFIGAMAVGTTFAVQRYGEPSRFETMPSQPSLSTGHDAEAVVFDLVNPV